MPNKLSHLTDYRAAPEADSFRAASIAELQAISQEIDESEHASLATKWAESAWECDRECCTKALELAHAGRTVFIAQDDDGYYFATEVEA